MRDTDKSFAETFNNSCLFDGPLIPSQPNDTVVDEGT